MDHIRILREVGDTPERETRPRPPEDEPAVRAALGEDGGGTSDVIEAEEGEATYTPRDQPMREPRKR